MTTTTFDPVRYKHTTTEQWQAAAEAWNRWSPTIEGWLGSATAVMLDLAGVREGSRVLDVAAGAGGQTLAAAARVGTTGRVLATDVAPAILAFAEHNARRAGLTNVATRVMDGEELDVEPGHFDAVISRVGLIYFPDQQRALHGDAARTASRRPRRRHRLLDARPQRVLLRAGLGDPRPGAAAPTGPRAAGPVQPGRARRRRAGLP